MTRIKTSRELDVMREGGRMLAQVFDIVSKAIVPGATGIDMAALATRELRAMGGEPAILGYQGFPASICISVNDAVVHGIPNNAAFKEGDIVSFDFCVLWAGMITDAARTVIAGTNASKDVQRLLSGTAASLDAGIATLRNGIRVDDISRAIEKVLLAHKLGIVRDLVGHGVGHAMHEEPNIPNYSSAYKGPRLKAGMTIAIEPMATLGGHRVYMDRDGWTIRAFDHSLAAHYEDTVLITETGFEILTRSGS